MKDVQVDNRPNNKGVVPTRRFWPLIPVAIVMGLVFHFFWPDGPAVLRAVVGTLVLVAAAAVVVLTYRERR